MRVLTLSPLDLQASGKVGCRYMNEAGFCYAASGQEWCASKPGNSRCVTEPTSMIPYKQQGECKERNPFSLNDYCTIYKSSGRKSSLRRCQRQDCVQERKGDCKYMSAEGYCWSKAGQEACAANPADERCVTKLDAGVEPPFKQSFACDERQEEAKDPLQINYYCHKYQQRQYGRWLRICADQDCAQMRSSIGCKFMDEKGYCYVASGQKFCADPDNAADERCISSPPAPPAYEKSSMCMLDDPLKLNKNCIRYLGYKRTRYLRRCEREDCQQARSKVGCRFMNSDGFCYSPKGQAYCAQGLTKDRCHTDISAMPPYLRNGQCKERVAPLTINHNCQRYSYRKRWRYLRYVVPFSFLPSSSSSFLYLRSCVREGLKGRREE